MNTALEWVITSVFQEFFSYLVTVLNSTRMLKKAFTPDKGYCRYRDRNNCGIISHSVAERWLNFSRSMRCFLLIPTHPPPGPPPAIPQIFQIKTLFVSRFITHSSRQIKFTSVDETFSLHSFRSEFFLCNHTYQKQGRNALKGAGLFHLNIYLLQWNVFLIIGSLKYGDYGLRLRFNMLCLCEFLYRICWMNVM